MPSVFSRWSMASSGIYTISIDGSSYLIRTVLFARELLTLHLVLVLAQSVVDLNTNLSVLLTEGGSRLHPSSTSRSTYSCMMRMLEHAQQVVVHQNLQ